MRAHFERINHVCVLRRGHAKEKVQGEGDRLVQTRMDTHCSTLPEEFPGFETHPEEENLKALSEPCCLSCWYPSGISTS